MLISADSASSEKSSMNVESTGGSAVYREPSSTMAQQPEEKGEREREQSTTEQLLDGLVVVFSDYQDCMDEDTMDKWKQVRGRGEVVCRIGQIFINSDIVSAGR